MFRNTLSTSRPEENKENVTERKNRSASANTKKKDTAHIRTVIRLRGNVESNAVTVQTGKNADSIYVYNSDIPYNFDRVLDGNASQQDVFEAVVGKGVEACLHGENFCILAYGQTGSGKTHSMLGTLNDPGVIPRFAENLCTRIQERYKNSKLALTASFYEVYKEKIYDLLSSSHSALNFTTHGRSNGLKKVAITNSEEIRSLQCQGLKRRATAPTVFNDTSSRSHAIFEINVHREVSIRGRTVAIVGRCFFVDLAGSERSTEVDPSQKSESIIINKSLFALQRVVDSRSKNANYVNYRDSVLTRILQPCFDGNANVTVLGAINPTKQCHSQTVNTLRFVGTTRLIVIAPRLNEDINGTVDTIPLYTDELLKTVKDAGSRLVTMNRPDGPCIVELFSDIYMNQWYPLQENFVLENAKGEPLVVFTVENDTWFAVAKNDGVDVNNEVLRPSMKVQLNHADHIVLHGSRFFVVSIDVNCDHSKFKYDSIKVAYLEATAERTHKMIAEKARAETALEYKALLNGINEEMKAMQAQLAEFKEKAQKTNVDKKSEVDLENDIQDYVAIQDEIAKQINATTTVPPNPRKSIESSQLSLNVKRMNDACQMAGVTHLEFSVNMKANQDIGGIRLCNKQSMMHANLSSKDFERFSENVSHLFNTCNDESILPAKVNALLYELDVPWEQTEVATSSYMLQDIVRSCIKQTADRRNSSVAEITRNFKKRNSVIASMVLSDIMEEESSSEQIFKFGMQYLDVSVLEAFGEDKHTLFYEFLQSLNEGYIRLAGIKYVDVTTNQKKAAYMVSAMRLRRVLSSLITGINAIASCKFYVDYDYEIKEIRKRLSTVNSNFTALLRQVKENDTLFTKFHSAVYSSYHQALSAVGSLLFYIKEVVPKEFHEIAPHVYVGFFFSLDCLLDDIAVPTMRDSKPTYASHFCLEAVNMVLELRKCLGTVQDFDTDFYSDAMIPAIVNYENMIDNRWRSTDPSDFYKTLHETISTKYDKLAGSEILDYVQAAFHRASKSYAQMPSKGFANFKVLENMPSV